MTMSSIKQHIPAAKFKSHCLALLDRVAGTGEALVVTKHGRPVAAVVPIAKAKTKSLQGSVKWRGDLVAPTGEPWTAED